MTCGNTMSKVPIDSRINPAEYRSIGGDQGRSKECRRSLAAHDAELCPCQLYRGHRLERRLVSRETSHVVPAGDIRCGKARCNWRLAHLFRDGRHVFWMAVIESMVYAIGARHRQSVFSHNIMISSRTPCRFGSGRVRLVDW